MQVGGNSGNSEYRAGYAAHGRRAALPTMQRQAARRIRFRVRARCQRPASDLARRLTKATTEAAITTAPTAELFLVDDGYVEIRSIR